MTRTFSFASLAALGAVLFISYPQLADPLIRYDDYPGFFGEPEIYYQKTLTEGRWLNYWWMLLETGWSSTVTFLLYQFAWAIFAAAAAANALGPKARRLDLVVLTVLIAFSPQAFLISGWFNTLFAGMWLVAAFAVATLFLSASGARWLFLLVAPISMMSYSTYPLLLFSLLLTRHDIRRSLGALVLLVGLLAISIVLGMLLMYTINWYAHGVFDIVIADWRKPSPATDLASLVNNLGELPKFADRLYYSIGYGHFTLSALNVTMLIMALAVLAARRPAEAAYILAGICATIGLMLVHSLKSGIQIPVRSLIVLWVYLAVAFVRAVQVYARPERVRSIMALFVLLAAVFGGQLQKHVRFSNAWQQETRDIVARIPEGTKTLVFYGNVLAMDGAASAALFHHYALSLRMRQLTGLTVVNCGDPAVTCNYDPPFDDDDAREGEVLMEKVDDILFALLPRMPEDRKAWAELRLGAASGPAPRDTPEAGM